jgi:hypothetical protein
MKPLHLGLLYARKKCMNKDKIILIIKLTKYYNNSENVVDQYTEVNFEGFSIYLGNC